MNARVLPAAVAVVTAAMITVSACSDDTSPPSDTRPDTASSASTPVEPVEPADATELIDIGGRALALRCWGEPVAGEATILLVSGQGPTVSYWDPLAAELALDGHHLCGYDRAGIGDSEPAPEVRRTTKDQVADLVALLDAAELNEPLVVVAHSLGSLPAIGLTDRAPERVVGVVLLDPWEPRVGETLLAALPPEKPDESEALAQERHFLGEFRYDPAQNSENLLVAACDEEAIAQLDKPGPLFGDRPVIVLQAPFPERPPGLPRDYDRTARAAWTAGNEEFAAESTRGQVIKVEDTGHDIHVDQPQVVIDAILDVLAG